MHPLLPQPYGHCSQTINAGKAKKNKLQPAAIPVQMGQPVALAGGYWSLMHLVLRPRYRQTGECIAQTRQAGAGQQALPFLQVTGAQI